MTAQPPSIADLLEATGRELAGTDARVYRRLGEHLQYNHAAIAELAAAATPTAPTPVLALLGKGSFQQQSATTLKGLCKKHGIKGYSKLGKDALAAVLEQHGVEPPPRPLERYTRAELIAVVRELIGSDG